jgi:hypothetical protein
VPVAAHDLVAPHAPWHVGESTLGHNRQAFAEAWAAGQALELEDVIAEAMAVAGSPAYASTLLKRKAKTMLYYCAGQHPPLSRSFLRLLRKHFLHCGAFKLADAVF